jgi:hypothetical protein
MGRRVHRHSVIGPRDVNVGDIVRTMVWTVAVVGLAIGLLLVLSSRGGHDPVLLLTGVDGHLSLAQTQVACWTIVVGSIVMGYGLIRLEIPTIPEALLVLMGASLVTGGVAYFQDAKRERAAVMPVRLRSARGRGANLVHLFPPGQPSEPSLAKAQMLFWDGAAARALRLEEHSRGSDLGGAVAAGCAHGIQPGRISGAQACAG